MKICSISDLHGNLIYYPSDYWKDLRECEILFICGDTLPLYIQMDINKSRKWLLNKFKSWAEELPVEKVYLIAGNHDWFFEKRDAEAHELFPIDNKITYLHNECVEHISIQDSKTYKIFGTPYCHQFGSWAFMHPEEELQKLFNVIPENLDILITHDAPYGTSDICFEGWSADGQHKGCPALRNAILEKKPKYNFHGHLHSSNHDEEILGETKVFNTSILNEEYKPTYYPLILRISK